MQAKILSDMHMHIYDMENFKSKIGLKKMHSEYLPTVQTLSFSTLLRLKLKMSFRILGSKYFKKLWLNRTSDTHSCAPSTPLYPLSVWYYLTAIKHHFCKHTQHARTRIRALDFGVKYYQAERRYSVASLFTLLRFSIRKKSQYGGGPCRWVACTL